jgi:predicted ATPase
MQSRLIVKNFGPIDYVDLDLRNVNVFIGPQASGKSALAKLYTIFKAPRRFLKNGNVEKNIKAFKEILEEYNIAVFLKSDTAIEFDSELHQLSYKNGSLSYEPKLLKRIQKLEKLKDNFNENKNQIKEDIVEMRPILGINYGDIIDILGGFEDNEDTTDNHSFMNLNEENFSEIISALEKVEVNLTTNATLYIPSERNFSNIIKKSALNLLINNVPIPKHILFFGAELEKIAIEEIKLDFLQKNLIYKSIDGEDRIFTDRETSIKLSESASGIQSVLPVLIPVLSHDPNSFQRSFVIEEPELNLFPDAQYELIKLLESNRPLHFDGESRTGYFYTTHSPYILSALNNLLYAYKVQKDRIGRFMKSGYRDLNNNFPGDDSLDEILKAELEPNYFSAYQIKNGGAESIFDREKGLIIDNYIDDVSDEMGDDFDALTRLMQ